jgi:hypothetical protein
MYSRSALSVITFCVGLAGTVAMAQERVGLLIPQQGIRFTTAFTNDFG